MAAKFIKLSMVAYHRNENGTLESFGVLITKPAVKIYLPAVFLIFSRFIGIVLNFDFIIAGMIQIKPGYNFLDNSNDFFK